MARIPCKTEEERLVRDRKAFLLHSLFIDTSIFKAVSLIRNLIDSNKHKSLLKEDAPILHEETIGDLSIVVKRDLKDASVKLEEKVDGSHFLRMCTNDVSRRNILKGLTADESVVVRVRILNHYTFHLLFENFLRY